MTVPVKLGSLAALLVFAVAASAQNRPAAVVVNLPADARLFVEDVECPLKSERRKFSTPALEPGVKYEYLLRVEVKHDGKSYGTTQRVVLRAGEEVSVTFGDKNSILIAAGVLKPEPPPVPVPVPPLLVPVVVPVPVPAKASNGPPGPRPRLVAVRLTADDDVAWRLEFPKGRRVQYRLDQFNVSDKKGPLDEQQARARLSATADTVVAIAPLPLDPVYWDALDDATVVFVPKDGAGLSSLPQFPILATATPGARDHRFLWVDGTVSATKAPAADPLRLREVPFRRVVQAAVTVELAADEVAWRDLDGDAVRAPAAGGVVLLMPDGQSVGPAVGKALNRKLVVVSLPPAVLDPSR